MNHAELGLKERERRDRSGLFLLRNAVEQADGPVSFPLWGRHPMSKVHANVRSTWRPGKVDAEGQGCVQVTETSHSWQEDSEKKAPYFGAKAGRNLKVKSNELLTPRGDRNALQPLPSKPSASVRDPRIPTIERA